jgi:hypothetical protein
LVLVFFVAISLPEHRFTAILSHFWPQKGAKATKTRLLCLS